MFVSNCGYARDFVATIAGVTILNETAVRLVTDNPKSSVPIVVSFGATLPTPMKEDC